MFLALPIPEALRRAAAEAARGLGLSVRDWRLVGEEGLHVTLRFLGEVDAGRGSELRSVWAGALRGAGPVPLRLGGAGVYPGARRPRVVWAGLEDRSGEGGLGRLAARLEEAARAHGFAPESRPFSPHVTLARARASGRVPEGALERGGDLGDFVADRVVLYRSELRSDGARYHEDASFPLVPEPTP